MTMKYLKIDSGKGYFLQKDNVNWQEIDQIGRDDILRFLDVITSNADSFEMDKIEGNLLQNEAHKIIYNSLWQKFNEMLDDRDRFSDESESLFKDAFEKYSNE